MNIRKLSLAVLGVLLASFLFASTASAGRAPKSLADVLSEEQSVIVKACQPTDAQVETLKEKFKLKQTALEAWDKANDEKVKAAADAALAARKGTDAEAKKKANGDQKALKKEREDAAAEADKAILAVLNDEQKVKLAGVKMADTMLPRYKKVNLTEDQSAKFKTVCTRAAKELSAIDGDDRKGKKEKATIQKSLKWAIDNVILTDEQQALVAPKSKTSPAAAK